MTESIAFLNALTKVFDKPAVASLTATLPKGKIIGLVGPDGAGKTTLLRLLAGLLLPTEGSVTIAGLDVVASQGEVHEIIGYMPQKFGLYEDLTVQQNLTLYANLRGVIGKEREEAFEQLLAFSGLAPFTSRLAGKLSGGMKQKLGLSCSLLGKPELLLLDEPSVGVDPISRRELWSMIRKLVADGVSVVWSTAYLDEAEQCDTVLLLDEGKLVYQGPPGELTSRVAGRVFSIQQIAGIHRQVLTAALERQEVLDGTIQGAHVRLLLRDVGIPPFVPADVGAGNQAVWKEETPRFEDAFIDILGGSAAGRSPLTTIFPTLPTMDQATVEADHLTKKFGTFTATYDVSFSIQEGEIFGLLGPNGAGKTTTFKMMCGLLRPTSGRSSVYGKDLQKAGSEARSHIGYMAQKFSLYGRLSVHQNLTFFSGVYGLQGRRQTGMIDKMVSLFALEPLLDTTADTLPLGFKQRLALACSLMHEPAVLFLDEPTSGVDPLTRREFWSHINGLIEKGVTVVVTTHFMDEAEYCDRIGLIYKSELIQVGTPDALKEGVTSAALPSPTLEDAFIEWISRYDREKHG